MRRSCAALGLLAAITLLAAACGGNGADQRVTIEPDEPVQIRSMLSVTGAPSLDLRRAVELAVKDFGLVHGHDIHLGGPLDSGCDPGKGSAAAEQVIDDAQVMGVIGTSCSAAAVAVSPLLSEAGLVMISPSNTSPALTSDLAGNPSSDYHPAYFRVSNNDLYQSRAVADYALNELNLRRLVVVDDGDPYTSALAQAFGNDFHGLGGNVAATATVQKGQADMADVLAEVAAASPDGVFLPLFTAEAAQFTRQMREFDGLEGVTLIVGAASLDSEFLALPYSEGAYLAGPETEYGSNVNRATGKSAEQVLAAYEAAYGGTPPSPYWAHAYDATTLLLAAIQRAAVRDDGNFLTRAFGVDDEGRLRIDRATQRRDIRNVSVDFHGLTGPLSCDEFGDCGAGVQNIYHHTDVSVTDPAQLSVVYRFAP